MRILFASLAAIALIGAPARAETDDIPLDLSGPNPTVTISINGGAPEHWILDTGAMGSLMNIERARALGLREEDTVQIGSPAGGTPMQGFLTTLNNVRVGGAPVASMRVVAAPWDHEDLDGVLSPNAFSGRLVTFDFGHALVHISDKTAATTPRGAGTPYRGEGPHRLPGIPITLGASHWTAHMDSGAPGGLVFPYSMASSLPLTAAPVLAGHAQFVDSVHDRYRATLNGQIQIGPLTLDHPQIEFIDGLPELNVGMQVLRRMRVTLDPEAQVAWAETE
jgi:hypothetical protein